ncbi:hypothetical protein DOTSEDRAFT_118862 [Dothistroma septosporum NZE10]|uniref:Enoyl reductase (ER) domain-containing protein n=1 Tax=Dothistroma septosporum (strain NZE10 / CBS 128990) TaxID=675120 RepID=N1Q4U6_DOTSN|nr:hypothetical protein DOTSEDRAFT_118862 [Dothistroma septosporum NZE10]
MSSTQISASVLHAAKDLRVEHRSLSSPADNEVQIRISSTGLCGSDLHYYSHFRNGDILVREPLSLGHESSGIVTEVGSSVSHLEVGDKVALEVGLPCESCQRCTEGRYNICPNIKFRSSGKAFPHFQGTLQERINHPAKWVYKLPEQISLDVGALLEPLGVALHAFRRSLMPKDASVVVFGAGAVGLLCAAVAKLKGAKQVVIADIDAGRLQFAVKNGFAHSSYTVPMRRGKDIDESLQIAKETAAEIGKVDGLGEVNVVFEATGVPSCVQAGIYATRPGGRIMLVGMGHPIQTLPLGAAALREVDIVGVFRYANTYQESIDIVLQAQNSSDGPRFSKLVTHRFNGLGDAVKAFEMAGKTQDAEGKLVIKVIIDSSDAAQGKV